MLGNSSIPLRPEQNDWIITRHFQSIYLNENYIFIQIFLKYVAMGPINWVNIGSGNGLLPDGTKPLPEPMLTYHQ